jgi:hypothetical protein
MLITVDGATKSGKSTLIENLRLVWEKSYFESDSPIFELLYHNPKVIEVDPSVAHPFTEWASPVFDTIPNPMGHHELVIQEGSHVTEDVQGNIFHSRSRLTRAQRVWMDMLLHTRGSTNLHVHTRSEIISERMRHNGTAALVPSLKLATQVANYSTSTLDRNNWITLNNDNHIETKTLHRVLVTALQRANAAQLIYSFNLDYIGGYRPRYMFVVDDDFGTASNIHGDSAWMPYRDTQGEFLLDALMDVKAVSPGRLPSFALLSVTAADALRVPDLWRTLDSPIVVPLGHSVREMLIDYGIPCTEGTRNPWFQRTHYPEDRLMYGFALKSFLEN